MALINVQPVQNPGLAHPPREQREKKSDLDKVLEGLNIANSAMGIAVNYEHINNYMKQNDALDQTAAGVLPAKDRLDAQVHGMQPVPEGTPGSQLHKFSSDDPGGFSKQAFIMPQKAETPMGQFVKAKGPNGPVYQWAERGGAPIDAYEEPKAPKEPKNIVVETVENGKVVRKIVPDTAGSTFEVPGKEGKPPTDVQFAAGGFAKRMSQAESVFGELTKKGFDRTADTAGMASYLPGSMKPDDLKSQEQAERNFANAILRKESGAAISKDEFANAEQQYFPRAGDSAEVLAQKQQNREQAIATMAAQAGPAMAAIPDVAKKAPGVKGGDGTAMAGNGAAAAAAHPQDNKALQWANQNRMSKDPETAAKAIEILRLNGK